MKKKERKTGRPSDVQYTETHEWVRATGKEAVVGITDYAVSQLSDLVHIEFPKVGEPIEQGAPFGEIESVKTVADLVAPISGKITAVNAELKNHLELLTNEPYEEGWLVKMKMSDPKELGALMSAEEYATFIETAEAEEKGDEDEESDEGEDIEENIM